MTLVQQATNMMEKLPIRSQQVVVDLLKMLSGYSEPASLSDAVETEFRRTGKSDFALPADFDERFDDLNEEITAMFMGERL